MSHVSEEHCILIVLPQSHAVPSSLLRTSFTTGKGLCGKAMETTPDAAFLCIVIPVLLYTVLAQEAFLQCGFPVLHKNIVI